MTIIFYYKVCHPQGVNTELRSIRPARAQRSTPLPGRRETWAGLLSGHRTSLNSFTELSSNLCIHCTGHKSISQQREDNLWLLMPVITTPWAQPSLKCRSCSEVGGQIQVTQRAQQDGPEKEFILYESSLSLELSDSPVNRNNLSNFPPIYKTFLNIAPYTPANSSVSLFSLVEALWSFEQCLPLWNY